MPNRRPGPAPTPTEPVRHRCRRAGPALRRDRGHDGTRAPVPGTPPPRSWVATASSPRSPTSSGSVRPRGPCGAARRRRGRRQDPLLGELIAPAPRRPAGARPSGTASTSATARCPTSPSPSCSAGSRTATPRLSPALAEAHPALDPLQPGRRLLSGGHRAAPPGSRRSAPGRRSSSPCTAPSTSWPPPRRCSSSSRTPTGPTAPPATCSPSSSAAPSATPSPCVVSYRTDDLHRRHPLRSTVAEWVARPRRARVALPPLADDDVRRLVRALHRRRPLRCPTCTPSSRAPRATRSSPRSWSRPSSAAARPARRPRRPAAGAAGPPRRRRPHRGPGGVGRRPPGRRTRCSARSSTSTARARARAARRRRVPRAGPRRRRRLRLPARAARRGGLRRPAARRAGPAARGLRRGDRRADRVDGTAAELARHARAAHDLDTAVRASIEAGDDAMSVGGPDEAAQHYETALELLADPGGPCPTTSTWSSLVVAHRRGGDRLRSPGARGRKLVKRPARPPAGRRARPPPGASADGAGRPRRCSPTTTSVRSRRPTEALAPGARRADRAARQAARRARPRPLARAGDDAARHGLRGARPRRSSSTCPMLVADATTTLAGIDQRAGDPDARVRAR